MPLRHTTPGTRAAGFRTHRKVTEEGRQRRTEITRCDHLAYLRSWGMAWFLTEDPDEVVQPPGAPVPAAGT